MLTMALGIAIHTSAYAQPPAHAGKDKHGYFVSGQIVVKPRAGVAEQVLQNIFSGEHAVQSRALEKINARILRVPEGKEQMIIERLSKNPHIEYAELDRYYEPNFVPNDPYYGSSWHHQVMHSPQAWDITQGDPNIIIAILDGGVHASHPDLAADMVPGWNVVSNNSDTSDINGHGTVTAGAAAAIGNNAQGVAGMAMNAKIMPIRITNDTGGSATGTNIAAGFIWAADHGAKVASNSYESHNSGSTMNNATGYLRDRGGVAINSAGNTGAEQFYSDMPNLITVSATNQSDVRTSWSSFGNYVDVSAPGIDILTTWGPSSYGNTWGTSLSAPLTAGVAALIFAANPALTPDDVETILETSAVDLGTAGWDKYYGHGRVDAAAAVQMALTYTPPERDTISPTASINTPGAGSTLAGTAIVDVTANDNIGVTKVDLLVNGAFYASDTNSPYSFAWDTSSLGNADVTLTAKAFDAAGNTSTSSGVPVLVRNIVDNTPPVVTISQPANGATVSGRNTTISASATDDQTVSTMRLYIDGNLAASASGGSLSYNWNLRKVSDGTHSIRVEATDASANTASQLIEVIKGGGSTGDGGGGGTKGGGKGRK
ncbi:MAG: S8 family serine peptidase [Alphaproteobacteria bacterium]